MRMFRDVLGGGGLFARAFRSAGWTTFSFGTSQVMRLVANLILTRLLFPEAFGLMALVSVFMVGLAMFSDVGLSPAIMQSARGDDQAYLNTAWTIQVLRGLALWLGLCALALPAAKFYGEPILAKLLPVAGLTLAIAGFNPTRIETANRHLLVGRLTVLDLISQAIGSMSIVGLAFMTRSVWALVLGAIIGSLAKLVLVHAFLPGPSNRFMWERSAAIELIHFGKWLLVSTALGFVVAQGDKAILGKYLSLELLGIYNIGYFLASAPVLLGGALISRLLIPIYREKSPKGSAENFKKIRWMRFGLTSVLVSMSVVMALFGDHIVGFLYDPRYQAAGGIVVLIACVQLPLAIGLTYDQAALAAGDSRSFFYLFVVRALLQVTCFIFGAEVAGLVGALVGQAISAVLVHPMIIWVAHRHSVWDPLHDALAALVSIAVIPPAILYNWHAIELLATFGRG